MTPRVRTTLIVAAGLTLFGLSAGGAALAVWTATGSGAGTGSTDALLPVVFSPGTPSSALYPGGQADVHLTVTNANAAAVRIDVLSLDASQGTGGLAVDAGHAGCPVSALSYATQSNGGAGWAVPAHSGGVDGTLSITLPNALSMAGTAANACQGATFTVYLEAG